MGTDIESIQQTYQSLMRGNYAMLDNLKLGYGGTKAELERLVADAEKLTGQALDPSKFSDVITAIHAVQENLGITGTTAKEASTTIQGSLNMMQSAWSNLVAGIGNENANMTSLIDNFVESVATVGENILPRMQQIFTGIGTLVQQLAPIIAEAIPGILSGVLPGLMNAASTLFMTLAASLPSLLQTLIPAVTSFITTNLPQLVTVAFQIMTTLVNGLIQALPQLAAAIPQIITAITTSLATAGPQLLQSGVQLLQQLATGIQNGLPQLAAVLPQIISNFINFIAANLPQILQQGVQIINSLVNGILNAIPELVANLPQVITAIVNFIVSSLPQILEAGVQILQNLITGIINTIPELVSNLPQIINAIVNGIGSLMGSIINIGGDIVRGIWDGISGAAGWLWSQITGWMSGIVNGIKGFFGIHSPSKLFRDEIGKNIGLGVAEGIEDSKDDAVKAAKELAESVYEESKDWIDKQVKYNEYSLRDQLEVWEAIQDQFIKESKQYADAEDQILDIRHQILEENKKLEQEYLDKFTARSQEIFNVYGLFDKVEEYDAVSGDYLLNNLADQVASIEDYYSKIDQLSQRSGVTEALLDEFRTKGPDAIEALDALLAMSEEKLDQYTALYEEKRALANEIAAKELSGLRESTNDEIEKNLLALQGKFETEGPQVGVSLVQGMANGIRSGKSAVISAVQEVANAAVNAAKSTLGVHSPSTVFAGIGEDMAQGMNVGWNDSLPGVLQSIESSLGRVPATMESPKAEVKPSSANQPAQQAGYTIIQNIQSVPLTPSELARQSVDAYRRLRWA